jgi:hypothetical protein
MADAPDDDLALMPRGLRNKLDRVGIKLHLDEWQRLSAAERRRLIDQPCATAADVDRYRADLVALVRERTGRAPDRLDRR